MKKISALLCACLFCACSQNVIYQPFDQLTPQHIRKIAVRPFINRTEVFALEDRLTIEVTDEFLRNGQYQVVREADADGIIIGQISRYLMVPLQYDNQMIPTTYRMDVWVTVQLFDVQKGVALWEEPALLRSYVFSASTLPGGMTEEQARLEIWRMLARDIVIRTTEGFGSVWSEDRRRAQLSDTHTTIRQ